MPERSTPLPTNNRSTERWLPVPNWEGFYEVSDQGRVRSVDRDLTDPLGRSRRFDGVLLKPRVPKNPPYLTVNFCRGSVQTSHRVHELVLLAFVGTRPPGLQIRHLNGNHLDCRLTNLAYGTRSENQLDTVRHGRNFQARKTHCPSGHEYTADNLAKTGGNRRMCKTCLRIRSRKSYREARAAS